MKKFQLWKIKLVLNKHRRFIFPIFLIILFIFLIITKIHGSSIGSYYEHFYGSSYNDTNLLFGEPRAIRSDEWLVESPLSISQSYLNFPINNDLFVAGQNLITMDVPIRSWITIFKPQNWGYFILPLENAFSYKWWFSSILLMLIVYFYLLKITKNDLIVSILLSVSLFFSPFFQWWYAAYVFEIALYGLLALGSAIQLFFAKSNKYILLSLLIAYFIVCFALVLYPPWQIVFIWFLIIIFIGIYLNKLKKENKAKNIKVISSLFASTLISISILLLFYLQFKEVIFDIQNSIYPGNRLSTGGGLTLFNTIGGFYNIQFLKQSRIIPTVLGNQSEGSTFFFLSFFLLPLYSIDFVKSVFMKRFNNWIFAFLFIYSILILGWGFGFLPQILGKLLLFDRVPGNRVLFVLGIMNYLAIAHYLFMNKNTCKCNIFYSIIYSIIVGLVVFYTGIELKNNWPLFIGSTHKIILISGFSSLLFFLLLIRKKHIFTFLLLFLSLLSTINVNPIYVGLDPIINNDLSKKLSQINDQDPKDFWIIYDNILLENYLAANGIKTVNGTYVIPNVDFWEQFDVERKYNDIYNRYAHVIIRNNDIKEDVAFKIVQNDVIEIFINPCNEKLKSLNVNKFIFQSPQDFVCLQYRDNILLPELSLYIYVRSK